MTGPASSRRLFVLLAWHPDFGASVEPVGVLAVDTAAAGAAPRAYTAWVPLTYELAQPWRDRLAGPPGPDRLERWLAEDGTAGIAEIPAGSADSTLAGLAEAALDDLLTLVLPQLPNIEGR